jgi:hypothetical protein
VADRDAASFRRVSGSGLEEEPTSKRRRRKTLRTTSAAWIRLMRASTGGQVSGAVASPQSYWVGRRCSSLGESGETGGVLGFQQYSCCHCLVAALIVAFGFVESTGF